MATAVSQLTTRDEEELFVAEYSPLPTVPPPADPYSDPYNKFSGYKKQKGYPPRNNHPSSNRYNPYKVNYKSADIFC